MAEGARDAEATHDGASAYEGRTDNPPSDTSAGRRGPATGSGAQHVDDGAPTTEPAREGGGAAHERD